MFWGKKQGCDASVIVASTPNNKAEKDHPDNLSLAGDGFDTVIKAKAVVDANPRCRNKVSCADILAMATRDVIALVGNSVFCTLFSFLLPAINFNYEESCYALLQSGGPSYPVELGRLDGLRSTAASVEGNLPKPTFNLNQLNAMFGAHGLSQTDMIALSGNLLPPFAPAGLQIQRCKVTFMKPNIIIIKLKSLISNATK